MSAADWGGIKEDLQGQAKQRLSGLDNLEALLKRTNLGRVELGELLDLSPSLLSDANSKVTQQALETLEAVVLRSDTALTATHASLLVPSVAERLGDGKQQVRTQALRVLVSLFRTLRPELVIDKLAAAWQHKNWKVRQGLVDVAAEVLTGGESPALSSGRDQNNALIKQVARMCEEPEMIVRTSAINTLSEVASTAPAAVISGVQAAGLRNPDALLADLRLQPAAAASDRAAKRGSGSGSFADAGSMHTSGGGSNNLAAVLNSLPPAATDAVGGSGRVSANGAGSAPSQPPRNAPAADATAPPAPAPTAAAKRGGFKDGGGVTTDGELPPVAPLPVSSERELRAEMEAATATLARAPDAEWLGRMAAMQRVEALVLGGAVSWEAFGELLKPLTQALGQQFKERRSTIARQTCHLIGVLSRALGPRFEAHALALLPTLFGVLVITVAVMAESADAGVRGALRHCQTGRVLGTVVETLTRDKNPKARNFCAGYLVLILEQWDSAVWVRHTDVVEAGIRAAVGDTVADTRALGRAAMAAYAAAAPDRAAAFVRRQDGPMQEKLAAALAGSRAASAAPPAAAASRPSIAAAIAANKRALAAAQGANAGPDVVVVVPPSAKAQRQPAAAALAHAPPDPASAPLDTATTTATTTASAAAPAPARPRVAQRTSAAYAAPPPLAASVSEASVAPPPLGPGAGAPAASRPARKSLGMPPGRVPGGSGDLTSVLLPESSATSVNESRIAALRRPRMSALPADLPQRVPAGPPSTAALRLPIDVPAAATTTGRAASGAAAEAAPSRSAGAPAPPPAAAAPAPAPSMSARAGPAWGAGSAGAGPAAAASGTGATDTGLPPPGPPFMGSGLVPLPRVVAVLHAGPRSWNEKVDALNALAAHVRAAAPGGPDADKVAAALERLRERLLEALDDPHQKVLSAALPLLADVVRAQGRVLEAQLDRLLPALFSRGAEAKEALRGLCGDVLAECGAAYRPDALLPPLSKCLDLVRVPRGRQAVLDFFRATAPRWSAVNAAQLKHWVVRLAPLLDDRAAELRRGAAEVVDLLLGAPWGREPLAYVAYQHNSADVAPLRRHLLALQHPHPSAALGASSSSSGGSGFLSAAAAAGPAAPAMALSGAPPATTADPRRQMPTAASSAAPMQAPVQQWQQPPQQQQGAAAASSVEEARTGAWPAAAGGPAARPHSSPQVRQPAPGTAVASARWPADGLQAAQPPPPQHQGSALGAAAYRAAAPGGAPPAQPGPGPSGAPHAPSASLSAGGAAQPPLPPPFAAAPGPYLGASLRARTSPGGALTPARPQTPVPPESGAQFLLLAQLMDRARVAVGGGGSLEEQGAAMDALADGVERCGRDAWVRAFPLLMVEVNSWVQHPVRSVRAMAYALLKELLAHQRHLFTDTNLDAQLRLLLGGCGDASREVCMTAGQALRSLLGQCSAARGLSLLLGMLPRERDAHRRAGDKGERLVAVMEGVRQLAARLERPELQRLTFSPHPDTGATLLEGLVANLADAETPVRRGAVVTLADLWFRLGPGVRDVLQVLASGSFHLLAVYYLKLHGVAVVAAEQNPTDHPLVTGADAAPKSGVGGAGAQQ